MQRRLHKIREPLRLTLWSCIDPDIADRSVWIDHEDMTVSTGLACAGRVLSLRCVNASSTEVRHHGFLVHAILGIRPPAGER
jgi:hypothetical protein